MCGSFLRQHLDHSTCCDDARLTPVPSLVLVPPSPAYLLPISRPRKDTNPSDCVHPGGPCKTYAEYALTRVNSSKGATGRLVPVRLCSVHRIISLLHELWIDVGLTSNARPITVLFPDMAMLRLNANPASMAAMAASARRPLGCSPDPVCFSSSDPGSSVSLQLAERLLARSPTALPTIKSTGT